VLGAHPPDAGPSGPILVDEPYRRFHDRLLVEGTAFELAGQTAVAEDVDAVADGQQLGHLARDEQEGGA
jgi:hypothetical protein